MTTSFPFWICAKVKPIPVELASTDNSGAPTRAKRTEPHTHGMWSTSFRLVVTSLTERTYVHTFSSETQGQSVGSGERVRRKFSRTGEKASGYRLSPNYFQKFKRIAGSWLGTENALYYCAQSANSFSWFSRLDRVRLWKKQTTGSRLKT